MKTIMLIGLICFAAGFLTGGWRQRKKILKKILPKDFWEYALRGINYTKLYRGHLTVVCKEGKITNLEFTCHLA